MTSPPEACIRRALVFARTYGSIDGAEHKQWIIDQMVRALLDCPITDMPYVLKDRVYYRQIQVASAAYDAWVADHNSGEEGPNNYAWEEGLAP